MALSCIFAALALAAVAGLVLTPLVIRGALRLNATDGPDGERKKQVTAVPLGGGLAVAVATAVGALTVLLCGADGPSVNGAGLLLGGLLPAALVILAVGVVDDFIGLTGIYKLIGQVLAAVLLAAAGAQFHVVSLFGAEFQLGSFSLAFSMFFILGAINAFNLIDGSDGLASSIGVVVLLTLGAISASQGNVAAAAVSFACAGALLGFLPYNWAPARIYLGDTGSMLIGLIVAYVAIDSTIKEQAAAALAVPVAVCAIPILDVFAALVRRVTTGQSVFTPDRGHLHHALLLRGLSVRQTALLAATLTAVTCGGALASYFFGHDWLAVAAVMFVMGGLAGMRVFGHAEARLVATHARTGWSGLWRRVRRNVVTGNQTDHSVAIQGSHMWDDLWSALRESAPQHGIGAMRLNINIPRLHEAFYGNWRLRDESASSDNAWRLVVPLQCEGQSVGKITVLGSLTGAEGLDLELLAAFLEPVQGEVDQIIVDLAMETSPVDGTVTPVPDVATAPSSPFVGTAS